MIYATSCLQTLAWTFSVADQRIARIVCQGGPQDRKRRGLFPVCSVGALQKHYSDTRPPLASRILDGIRYLLLSLIIVVLMNPPPDNSVLFKCTSHTLCLCIYVQTCREIDRRKKSLIRKMKLNIHTKTRSWWSVDGWFEIFAPNHRMCLSLFYEWKASSTLSSLETSTPGWVAELKSGRTYFLLAGTIGSLEMTGSFPYSTSPSQACYSDSHCMLSRNVTSYLILINLNDKHAGS